jgi:hypothetical protein
MPTKWLQERVNGSKNEPGIGFEGPGVAALLPWNSFQPTGFYFGRIQHPHRLSNVFTLGMVLLRRQQQHQQHYHQRQAQQQQPHQQQQLMSKHPDQILVQTSTKLNIQTSTPNQSK